MNKENWYKQRRLVLRNRSWKERGEVRNRSWNERRGGKEQELEGEERREKILRAREKGEDFKRWKKGGGV